MADRSWLLYLHMFSTYYEYYTMFMHEPFLVLFDIKHYRLIIHHKLYPSQAIGSDEQSK